MTKFSLMSDIHLEFDMDFRPSNTEKADILLLAGDIVPFKYLKPNSGLRDRSMSFFEHIAKEWPMTYYIPGNHEYYGGTDIASDVVSEINDELPENVYLFNNEFIELPNGYLLFGATMWTDMNKQNPLTILEHGNIMNDARAIKDKRNAGYRFTAHSHIREHMVSKIHLQDVIEFNKPTIVMTHHAPSTLSVHPRYKDDRTNGYYNSDLTALMKDNVHVWVHGHTHDTFEYTVMDTKVLANPKGYHDENTYFNPTLTFEL